MAVGVEAEPRAASSACARIDPEAVFPSSIWMSSCFTNLPRMLFEQIWYVPRIGFVALVVTLSIWICASWELLMPMRPPLAFLGTYGSASDMSVIVVGPEARFESRTCCQKSADSSVAVVVFQLPLMTPLPWRPAGVVASVAPVMWVVTWASSPGSALNLSWNA